MHALTTLQEYSHGRTLAMDSHAINSSQDSFPVNFGLELHYPPINHQNSLDTREARSSQQTLVWSSITLQLIHQDLLAMARPIL